MRRRNAWLRPYQARRKSNGNRRRSGESIGDFVFFPDPGGFPFSRCLSFSSAICFLFSSFCFLLCIGQLSRATASATGGASKTMLPREYSSAEKLLRGYIPQE